MQAPLPPHLQPSPYQPPVGSMSKSKLYAFPKWLMVGTILLVCSSLFSQLPLESSLPDPADYDFTDDKEADQYDEDVDSYLTQISVFGALSNILQTGGMVLLGYAFIREAHEESGQHVAMRITFVLAAVILLTSIFGRSFSLL